MLISHRGSYFTPGTLKAVRVALVEPVAYPKDSVSYWLSFMGTVLSLPIAVWDSFMIPYLAIHAPDLILQIEEVSVETPVLIFRTIVFLTVFIFSVGFVVFGIGLIRLRFLNQVSGACFILGAPLFWIGALFFSKGSMGNIVTEIGATLFGVGLILLGKHLLDNVNATKFHLDLTA
ncbi:MAG: hypothetical protein FWK01_28870 [Pantanalinema sp. GBBB05]|nr:hypothetical protein [Pantanalinema sp. GBBB05]